MKYALIGCGMICANHIRAALETGLEIVALCDLVEENREKALALIPEEKRSGVKLYADYRAMLSEQRPGKESGRAAGFHGRPGGAWFRAERTEPSCPRQ